MAKKIAKSKRPKPHRSKRFGILNHVGDVWTVETFETAPAAMSYLLLVGKNNPSWQLGQHKVIPVRVTVSAAQ